MNGFASVPQLITQKSSRLWKRRPFQTVPKVPREGTGELQDCQGRKSLTLNLREAGRRQVGWFLPFSYLLDGRR